MSNQLPVIGRGRGGFPTLPQGEKIASYSNYARALEALDVLVKADFPVAEISIVGDDLVSVERITGRMSYARAAGRGAMTGAWFGLFLTLLMSIYSVSGVNPVVALAPILIGAGIGMILSMVFYTVSRKRKDFSSVTQVLASSYSLVVSGGQGNRAKNILGLDFGAPKAPASLPPAQAPADAAPAGESADDSAETDTDGTDSHPVSASRSA